MLSRRVGTVSGCGSYRNDLCAAGEVGRGWRWEAREARQCCGCCGLRTAGYLRISTKSGPQGTRGSVAPVLSDRTFGLSPLLSLHKKETPLSCQGGSTDILTTATLFTTDLIGRGPAMVLQVSRLSVESHGVHRLVQRFQQRPLREVRRQFQMLAPRADMCYHLARVANRRTPWVLPSGQLSSKPIKPSLAASTLAPSTATVQPPRRLLAKRHCERACPRAR